MQKGRSGIKQENEIGLFLLTSAKSDNYMSLVSTAEYSVQCHYVEVKVETVTDTRT